MMADSLWVLSCWGFEAGPRPTSAQYNRLVQRRQPCFRMGCRDQRPRCNVDIFLSCPICASSGLSGCTEGGSDLPCTQVCLFVQVPSCCWRWSPAVVGQLVAQSGGAWHPGTVQEPQGFELGYDQWRFGRYARRDHETTTDSHLIRHGSVLRN
jgi:hypothetical protein